MNLGNDISSKKNGGFTLIEMLTVLVIIGLMSSAVILTFPNQKSGLELQARSFLQTVNLTAQEALLSGQSTALGLSKTGYGVYTFEDTGWILQSEQDWEGRTRPLFESGSQRVELPQDLLPLVIFESTGLSDPFTLTLSGPERKFVFLSQGDGRISLEVPS